MLVSQVDNMLTVAQIVDFALHNSVENICNKGVQVGATAAEIEFALRIKELMLMERKL